MAYAFKVNRVNPDFVSFKIWILGYYSKVCSIAVASLPKIVAQLDTALAEGECEFELGGIRFSADEKLLKSIRKEFSSYCCNEGVSDANNAPVKPSCIAATESVKKCGAKTKASAPQGSASAARHFDSSTETGEADFIAQPASRAESANGADASAVADGLIQAFREALRAELAPIRATLDALSFKVEEMAVFAKGNSALPLPESSFPRTKRGRTSVVVGVRKVAKFQPKTKGKSK